MGIVCKREERRGGGRHAREQNEECGGGVEGRMARRFYIICYNLSSNKLQGTMGDGWHQIFIISGTPE